MFGAGLRPGVIPAPRCAPAHTDHTNDSAASIPDHPPCCPRFACVAPVTGPDVHTPNTRLAAALGQLPPAVAAPAPTTAVVQSATPRPRSGVLAPPPCGCPPIHAEPTALPSPSPEAVPVWSPRPWPTASLMRRPTPGLTASVPLGPTSANSEPPLGPSDLP